MFSAFEVDKFNAQNSSQATNSKNYNEPDSLIEDNPFSNNLDLLGSNKDGTKTRHKYAAEIQQMMYVFGDHSDPIIETVNLIEEIVQSQIMEFIAVAGELALKRGSRVVTPEDLIFLIRHDKGKVTRLKTFLAWKDVRKNTKDAGGDKDVEELIDDDASDRPTRPQSTWLKNPWDIINNLTDVIDKEDEPNEESNEAYQVTLQRLKDADEITRDMGRDEYVYYSECRQASFVYRKAKKFQEWCRVNDFILSKPSDDLIDTLGFLTFEFVSTITKTAMQVRREQSENLKRYVTTTPSSRRWEDVDINQRKRQLAEEDGFQVPQPKHAGSKFSLGPISKSNTPVDTRIDCDFSLSEFANPNEPKSFFTSRVGLEKTSLLVENPNETPKSLFAPPLSFQDPLEISDIQEAFRILQLNSKITFPSRNFRKGLVRTSVILI